jgi:hypothetical protein
MSRRDLPAVEDMCWRCAPPARAVSSCCLVVEPVVVDGEVAMSRACGER